MEDSMITGNGDICLGPVSVYGDGNANGRAGDGHDESRSHIGIKISGRRMKTVILAVAAVSSVIAVSYVRYECSPKIQLIGEMKELSDEMSDVTSPMFSKLSDGKYGEMLRGTTHSDISLNISNTDEWPETIGVDGTLIRNGADGSVSADTELSVSNTKITQAKLYAGRDEFAVSFPELSKDCFTMSPEHIGKQFNESIFSDMTGMTSDDFSVEMPVSSDTAAHMTDYARIISGIEIDRNSVNKSEDSTETVYDVNFDDSAWKEMSEAAGVFSDKLLSVSQMGSLLLGEQESFGYSGVSFEEPYAKTSITADNGKINKIVLQDIHFTDKEGTSYSIPELSIRLSYAGSDDSLDNGKLKTITADGKVVSAQGKVQPFEWSESIVRNSYDEGADFSKIDRLTYNAGGKKSEVEMTDDEFTDTGRVVLSLSCDDGRDNGLLCLDGIFDTSVEESLKVKLNELSMRIDSDRIFKVTGSAAVSGALDNEKVSRLGETDSGNINVSKMSRDDLKTWFHKTLDYTKGTEGCGIATDVLLSVRDHMGMQ